MTAIRLLAIEGAMAVVNLTVILLSAIASVIERRRK